MKLIQVNTQYKTNMEVHIYIQDNQSKIKDGLEIVVRVHPGTKAGVCLRGGSLCQFKAGGTVILVFKSF